MQQQRRALVMLMVLVLHVISTTTTQVCCCLLEEKRALLDFKASINETRYAHLLLPSWTNINGSENGVDEEASSSDCCNWEGVKCSNTTGRIVELQLRNLRHNIYKEAFYENRDWYLNMSTFLSLTHLQALDLGYNNFQSGVEDCGQLASLENLESLNLDYNYFNISIIPCITAIPALKTLSLAGNYFLTGLFSVEDCGQLASLENLESLNLDYNGFNISIIPCVTSIPALKTLSLAGNNLEGVFPVEDCGQLASLENLESLNLDYNGFNISIIPCVTSIPALKTLSLAGNNLEGVFPVEDCGQLASLENLESLNLDDNYFNISIIPCITAIPALKTLSLAENNLEGVFPVEEFNHLTQLKNLNLSYTGLQGPLSFKELKLEKLEVLNLEGTQMKELLSIEVMTSLKALSLSGIGINDSSILEEKSMSDFSLDKKKWNSQQKVEQSSIQNT
ncbi:hypothetical protein ACH5RR_024634 [Cinchona calisaya]|uniref:Leucine-rich repeat-containing N-terminal plant-type domain-containing protein n=1 Tax=Cinchona calisaya TaxID=153742 RepID=A0ABD2YXA5_9GENT